MRIITNTYGSKIENAFFDALRGRPVAEVGVFIEINQDGEEFHLTAKKDGEVVATATADQFDL